MVWRFTQKLTERRVFEAIHQALLARICGDAVGIRRLPDLQGLLKLASGPAPDAWR
jgi:hypothetical protein